MKKLTNKQFLEKLNEKHGNKLIPLDEYTLTNVKINIKCDKGHTFKASPLHLINKKPTGCPLCKLEENTLKMTFTEEKVIEKVNEISEGYIIKDWLNYQKTSDKVLFKHSCGNEFEMTVNNFISGQRCPIHKYDNAKLFEKKDHNHYLNKIEKLDDFNEYHFLEKFDGGKKKVKVKHLKCNTEYLVSPQKFIDGRRCPYCSSTTNSKPTIKIKEILDNKNINYIKEKTFSDLINPETGKRLRLDFYLKDLNIAIEYDGEMHYLISKFNNEEKLKYRKKLDEIKTRYCKDNNIRLLRISYLEKLFISEKIEDFIKSSTTIPTGVDLSGSK